MRQGIRRGSARDHGGQGDERQVEGGERGGDGEDGGDADLGPGVVTVPITDELDLHTFAPREVADLVANYLDECAELGFQEVRIVHGKGTGTLRRVVHSVLDRHPAVTSYRLADAGRGGWGATLVTLTRRAG